MQSSTREEASLQSKIQAMKNLLQIQNARGSCKENFTSIKSRNGIRHTFSSSRPTQPMKHKWYSARNRAIFQAKIGNRTWSRFKIINNRNNESTRTDSFETKKSMWNKLAPFKHFSNLAIKSVNLNSSTHEQANRKNMENLQLDGSVYAKVNGGFGLVRSGALSDRSLSSVSTARLVPRHNLRLQLRSRTLYTKPYVIPRTRAVNYKQSRNQIATWYKTKPIGATRHVAQAAIHRARLEKAKQTLVRTEYCLFYNRFGQSISLTNFKIVQSISSIGCCNKKNACKYIHDSRKVAVCPKFLIGSCDNPKCLLSHKHDQNKMPVCKLFLRGACTRESCKYRHIKVSSSADICPAFLKGYCPLQSQCCLKHELPPKKRKFQSRSLHPGEAGTILATGSRKSVEGTFNGQLDTLEPMQQPGSGSQRFEVCTSTPSCVERNTVKSKESPSRLVIRPNLEMAIKRQKVELFPLALRKQYSE
uniref:Uncharacterized protein AlNc14C5G676 n=1 Tax=Albugo laibachii Nc14 TaxID=890382 RepID=F0W0N7_9STRA|nr:hypothetical protein PPL_03164 [Albugo laibachii Nc14]|eukprot:CCA14609.1 hypothetical protein PPL_03164 [Albugo laibachii Nc14]